MQNIYQLSFIDNEFYLSSNIKDEKPVMSDNGRILYDNKIVASTEKDTSHLKLNMENIEQVLIVSKAEKLAYIKYFQKAQDIQDSKLKGYIISATKGGYIEGYVDALSNVIDKKFIFDDMISYNVIAVEDDKGLKLDDNGCVQIIKVENFLNW